MNDPLDFLKKLPHSVVASRDLDDLRQIPLLNESAFLRFSQNRGLPVFGVLEGDPGNFYRRGWLKSDGEDHNGEPLFHPFRLYPLHCILECLTIRIAVSAALNPEPAARTFERLLLDLPSYQLIRDRAEEWNSIVDLAILLEPIFWPSMVSSTRLGLGLQDADRQTRIQDYQSKIFTLLRGLNISEWFSAHESLRISAAWMDKNDDLYLLLRVSHWQIREKLEGRISGALWIRHIAELIRRGFEKACSVEWLEEDRAFGYWSPGGRTRVFGSERPLDRPFRAKPYLSYRFGLFTGSSSRWYVEGETEYYAVLEALGDPGLYGVAVVDLRGNIKTERANIALKLEDSLLEDKIARRFSMITFDHDELNNVRTVRKQVEHDNIIGRVTANKPDFEFSNFTVNELVEIAAKIDEESGFNGNLLRNADWNGITKSKDFEKKYLRVSDRKVAGLKGETWGRALAGFALRTVNRPDTGVERPFVREISSAFWGWRSNYDWHKEKFRIDPDSFEIVPRQP